MNPLLGQHREKDIISLYAYIQQNRILVCNKLKIRAEMLSRAELCHQLAAKATLLYHRPPRAKPLGAGGRAGPEHPDQPGTRAAAAHLSTQLL